VGGVYQTSFAPFHGTFPARPDGSPSWVTSDSLQKEAVTYFGEQYWKYIVCSSEFPEFMAVNIDIDE